MDEWHIGDPVDWGDGWMDAQNWGHGNGNGDDGGDDYGYSGPSQRIERNVDLYANLHKYPYEKYIDLARKSVDDDEALDYYEKAVYHGSQYIFYLKDLRLVDESFPSDKKDLLSDDDIARCTQMYISYKKKRKGILFKVPLHQELVIKEIFKKTGNELVI